MRLMGKLLAADRPHSGTEKELSDICGKIGNKPGDSGDPLMDIRNRKRNMSGTKGVY